MVSGVERGNRQGRGERGTSVFRARRWGDEGHKVDGRSSRCRRGGCGVFGSDREGMRVSVEGRRKKSRRGGSCCVGSLGGVRGSRQGARDEEQGNKG